MSDRPITTDALATLGTIIGEGEKRDAIHIAVEPVIAQETLAPGNHVSADGKRALAGTPPAVGIVDPFLTDYVNKGECFWLLIYPRKINSLRHVWSHPAFPDEPEIVPSIPSHIAQKADSERWLRDFLTNADCPGDYNTIIAIASGEAVTLEEDYGPCYVDGEYFHFSGLDAHGEIPSEFWDHVEIVTGKKITARANYFSCSC